MSGSQEMGSLRKRPMSGMAQTPPTEPNTDIPAVSNALVDDAPQPPIPEPVVTLPAGDGTHTPASPKRAATPRADARTETSTAEEGSPDRRPAADYATTRLVNFRLPVDLHDRYRQLVRDAESQHPRLRRPSLTELIIALLEEGPTSGDGVAELIRRKRIAEHQAEASS